MKGLDIRDSVLNQLQPSTNDCDFSVQSLTIMGNQRDQLKTLYELSETKKSLRKFFSATGNFWPKEGWFALARTNFVLSKLANLICAGLIGAIVVDFAERLDDTEDNDSKFLKVYITLYLMLFLATLSVLPAQYFNRQRMKAPTQIEDFMAVDECLRVSYMFGFVSSIFVVAGVILEGLVGDGLLIYTCGSSLFVVMSLMFNMFFLVLDLKVSLLLLDQLHVLADKKDADYGQF